MYMRNYRFIEYDPNHLANILHPIMLSLCELMYKLLNYLFTASDTFNLLAANNHDSLQTIVIAYT